MFRKLLKDTIKFFFPNYGILTEFLPQLRKEYLKYFGDANWKSANEKLEVYKEVCVLYVNVCVCLATFLYITLCVCKFQSTTVHCTYD